MKITGRLISLTLIGQIIKLVRGEFMILSGPQYKAGTLSTFDKDVYAKDAFCITDEIISALIWNINFNWNNQGLKGRSTVSKSEVINVKSNERSNETLNYQSNDTSTCLYNWKKYGDWINSSSLEMAVSPVFDSQWEDFPEVSMTDTFQKIINLPNSGSFSVSIRGSEDAQFALCDQNNSQNNNCFHIVLGKLNDSLNTISSTINKCESYSIKSSSTDPKCNFLTIYNANVLSEYEWKTFTVTWDFQINSTELSVHDNKKNILNYYKKGKDNILVDNGVIVGKKISLLARSNKEIQMKFHTIYGFLKATTTNSTIESPKFRNSLLDNNICIEISISLCRQCAMRVSIIDRLHNRISSQIFKNPMANDLYDLPKWQNIKFKKVLPDSLDKPVSLEISTLFSSGLEIKNTYWLISNVHKCNEDSIKVTKYKAYQDVKDDSVIWPSTISCQKISPNGSSTILYLHNFKESSVIPEKMQLCSEDKIGSLCLVSCSKLFPNYTNCQSLVACDINGCSCRQGFMWPNCETSCSSTNYGHHCKQKCGNCLSGCHFVTGHCRGDNNTCSNTEINFYLPPYCKEEVKHVIVPIIKDSNSTSVKIFFNLKKELKDIADDVHFEIWQNSSSLFNSGYLNVENETTVEFFQDHLFPRTEYKAITILDLKEKGKALKSKWVIFTTSNAVAAYLNIYIPAYLICLISFFVYL